ncbi:MAG: Tyrosine-specific transport protein, partial [Chlamydiae bacterium]|nr:Tyrosine-specific transport protein [Chlamydiota bacterium]
MGAGMLAIPLVTGISGFFPAMLINIICWLFMTATGLLFLEATLWMPDGSNVLSMAGRFLGPLGKLLGGVFFLFLYYCLMISYIAGGAPLLTDAIRNILMLDISIELGYVIYTLLLAGVVATGAWLVDRVNWILMTGLILAFFLLIGFGASDVNPDFLLHKRWALSFFAAPILFSAYGFHNIVPSLSTYLKRNRRHLRIAVITGTTLPFIVYSAWQWLIIGSVPLDQLQIASSQGVPASRILAEVTGTVWVGQIALFFGFFAIVTSLLGVSLSMVDFLGDGFHVKKRTGLLRLGLVILVFGPPAVVAFNYPMIFVEALGIAGGIGEAFLNGLLPIAMVWIGRYHMKLEGRHLLFGGRGLLSFLLIFTIFIMA